MTGIAGYMAINGKMIHGSKLGSGHGMTNILRRGLTKVGFMGDGIIIHGAIKIPGVRTIIVEMVAMHGGTVLRLRWSLLSRQRRKQRRMNRPCRPNIPLWADHESRRLERRSYQPTTVPPP